MGSKKKIKKDKEIKKVNIKSWHALLLLVAVGFLIYFKSFSFEFNSFDEDILILENKLRFNNIDYIFKAFQEEVFPGPIGIYYRPLLSLSFMLDYNLSGVNPIAYRISNFVFHIISGFLLFIFLNKLYNNRTLNLHLSILFIVHPLMTQAVAWVPGRNDSLLTIFVLSAFIAFLNFIIKNSNKWYLFHLLFFGAALFSKESAVFLPLICLLYLHLIVKEKYLSRRESYLIVGWLLFVGLWFFLRSNAIQNSLQSSMGEILNFIVQNSPAFILFVGKILFPFNLSTYPILKDSTLIYGYLGIFILLLLIYLRRKRLNYMPLVIGFIWFMAFLFPSLIRSNVNIPADFLEHRVYLSFVGFLIILLEIINSFNVKFSSLPYYLTTSGIILILSVITFNHNNNFKDGFTYWKKAVSTSPNSAIAHSGLGKVYFDKGLLQDALRQYQLAIDIDPKSFDTYESKGMVYQNLGQLQLALETYKKALSLNPNLPRTYQNIGIIFDGEGKFKDAENYYKKAIELDSSSAINFNNLGINLSKQGRLEEAEIAFKKALRLQPDYGSAHYNLSLLYYSLEKYDLALQHFKEAEKLGVNVSEEMQQVMKQFR